MPRLSRIAAALSLALLALPVIDVVGLENQAMAEEADAEIKIGTQLEAVTNVTLHRASLVKGSRVSVTNLILRRGHLDGLKVALADGHVIKMAIKTVHSFFRVADE